MLSHLADVSIRCMPLAAMAAVFLQKPRSAALQHAVWTVVAAGMLGLFALGGMLPRLPVRVLTAPAAAPAMAAVTSVPARHFILPQASDTAAPARQAPSTGWKIDWIALAYGTVTLAFLVRFAVGMLLVRRLIRKSTAAAGFRESEIIAVPLTVGWFRPVILLPMACREWDGPKLEAVLAHEGAHARRRDGLIAAIAGINRCLFWFHPLAWWLERRLAFLAELACDDASVAATGDRERYARLLVEMAQVVGGSRGRLREHVFAMASRSHVGKRVRAILEDGRMFSKGVTRMGWTAIVLGGIALVWTAGAITLDHRVPLSPLRPLLNSPRPPQLMAQARPAPAATPAPAPSAQFEVASIRPSDPSANGHCLSARFTMNAGRIDIRCVSLQQLMEYAFRLPQKQVDGPEWLHHHRGPQYDISAKLPQGATKDQMPEMLKALLVDRFKLVYHLEHREQNVDVLVAGKGGLKLQEVSPPASSTPSEPDAPAKMQTVNGILMRNNSSTNGLGDSEGYLHTQSPDKIHWDFSSTTLEGLAGQLAEEFQRPVVDMTGLKGQYHVVLDVNIAGIGPGPNPAPGPITLEELEDEITDLRNRFNTELQKTGLQLEMRKAPVEYVVADRVEQKPTDN